MLASQLFAWGGAVGEILDDDADSKLTRLLDEDELLQEIKSHNEALVMFLAEPSSVAHLVHLVTQPLEHEDGITEDERLRRTMRWPYMACEVLCCDVSEIIDTLAVGSHCGRGHLAALLSIADTEEPVESRLAGYFEKAWRVFEESFLSNEPLPPLCLSRTPARYWLRSYAEGGSSSCT